MIQDNRKLPQIIAGLEALFNGNQPAVIILKSILLHQSLSTVGEWPSAAPLSKAEMKEFLDQSVLLVLGSLILGDSDSWNLFDLETKQRYRTEIVMTLGEISALLEPPSAD